MSAGTLVHATNEDEIDAVFTTFVREQITATAHPGLDRGRPRQDERPLVHGEVVLGAGRRSRERP
jgi:hypothetical protein